MTVTEEIKIIKEGDSTIDEKLDALKALQKRVNTEIRDVIDYIESDSDYCPSCKCHYYDRHIDRETRIETMIETPLEEFAEPDHYEQEVVVKFCPRGHRIGIETYGRILRYLNDPS